MTHRTSNFTSKSFVALGMVLCSLAPLATHAHSSGHGKPAAAKEQKPWGIAGDAKQVQRTITLKMSDDMRFAPDRIEVREGETVRLEVVNTGKVLHELVIGTRKELKAHAEMMKKSPGMAHEEPYMVHVDPGKRGQLVWTFNRAGDFEFACLIPGHFEAGMIGRIKVVASGKPSSATSASNASTPPAAATSHGAAHKH